MKITKKLLTSASLVALFTYSSTTFAQSTSIDDILKDSTEAVQPKTTRERIDALKQRHKKDLTILSTALKKIVTDPKLLTAKSTFAAIDKGDRDMKRSKKAAKLISSTLQSELSKIKSESAFSNAQKTELEDAINTLDEECKSVSQEADTVIKNLSKSYKAFPKLKKIYRSYLNLQGEEQAEEQIKDVIKEYVNNITVTPAEEAPTDKELPAEEPVEDEE